MAQDFQEPYIPRMASFGRGDGSPLSGVLDGLSALNDSVKHIQLTRSVNAANSNIQQMLLDEDSEAKVNQARAQAAQQIGQQAITLGIPASSVQTLQHSFLPIAPQKPQYTNIPELAAYGTPEQRQNLLDFYSKYKPPKEVDQGAEDLKTEKRQAEVDKIFDTQRTKLADKVDKAQASGRKLLGRLANTQAKLEEIKGGLLSDPNGTALNKLTLPEVAQALSSVFTGGVGTVSGSEHLMPQSLNQKMTDTRNYLSSGMEPYKIPAVAKGYNEIVDRLLTIVPAQQNEAMKRTMRGELSLAKKDPDKFSNIAEAHLVNPDGTPDKAYVKNNRVRFQSDDKIDELKDGIKWAMQNAKKDPQKAGQVFNAIKENPFYMQALQGDPTFSKMVIGAGKSLGSQ